jgi:hypothetical protein
MFAAGTVTLIAVELIQAKTAMGAPFQFTVAPDSKFEPLMATVKTFVPAIAAEGDRDTMEGMSVCCLPPPPLPPELPPPQAEIRAKLRTPTAVTPPRKRENTARLRMSGKKLAQV